MRAETARKVSTGSILTQTGMCRQIVTHLLFIRFHDSALSELLHEDREPLGAHFATFRCERAETVNRALQLNSRTAQAPLSALRGKQNDGHHGTVYCLLVLLPSDAGFERAAADCPEG
jgi:hypothetical protein